jgi:penicillin-binding protein 1C
MGRGGTGVNLRYLPLLIAFIAILLYWVCLPAKLFDDPVSTILLAEDESLLGARLAADEQWRFPGAESVPEKFEKCILSFEDRYFYYHPGVNPPAMFKALVRNLKAGRIVNGGSTISMQVIRLSRKNKRRTYAEKLIEVILATRLEMRYSKKEILKLYCSNAPFGGNVVGLDAAAWRYYGRRASTLSWGEAATMAVLPNSPALIYPGRNAESLRKKRNRLLQRLQQRAYINERDCELAMQEPLPDKAFAIPHLCDHLLDRAIREHPGQKLLHSSLDAGMQQMVMELAQLHHTELSANDVNNLAVLIVETSSGKVVSYVGNVSQFNQYADGKDVDIITSNRSTGSILKPLLYAGMLSSGQILPNTLIKDVPVFFGSFHPQNYHRDFDGAVPARKALSRSLNVPAVVMLKDYSTARFYELLKSLGITSLTRPPSHYGLSLILGGAEANLWDLAGIYTGLSRLLIKYSGNSSMYNLNDYFPPWYLMTEKPEDRAPKLVKTFPLSASSIWFMLQAMNEVNRPDQEGMWEEFSSSKRIAWKTGTSFGNRDAWAVGITPTHFVGVWAGNASGEGRPSLTGLDAAAPLMFDVFRHLPSAAWFLPPFDDMEKTAVCRRSGHKASPDCFPVDTVWVPVQGLKTQICPYHRTVFLNPEETHRVNSSCMSVSKMHAQRFFVLPPVEEFYFKQKNAFYKSLPPFLPSCEEEVFHSAYMDILYPDRSGKIILPKGLSGERNKVILKAVHRNAEAVLYWYLNTTYLGSTRLFHQMAIAPAPGDYMLTVTDQSGRYITRKLRILPPE